MGVAKLAGSKNRKKSKSIKKSSIEKLVKMTGIQSSWADEIEEGDSTTLPMPSEIVQGNKKITTEYSINDDGKKTKIVRTFEIITKRVPKSVAQRKLLPKFGMSRKDRPGPDPATTIIAEEIFMNFVHNKEEHEKDADDNSALKKLKDQRSNRGVVQCRICKEDHWTTQCPYKDKIGILKDLGGPEEEKPADGSAPAGGAIGAAGANAASSAGDGGARVGESMNDRRRSKIGILIFYSRMALSDI